MTSFPALCDNTCEQAHPQRFGPTCWSAVARLSRTFGRPSEPPDLSGECIAQSVAHWHASTSITYASGGPEWKTPEHTEATDRGSAMPSIFRWRNWQAPRAAQPAPPRTEDDIRAALRLLPHYRVLLHNDDTNAMDDVVVALIRTVSQLSIDDAVRIMLEAHTKGLAQVVICPRETAEFYRERLEHYGLTSTIEPA